MDCGMDAAVWCECAPPPSLALEFKRASPGKQRREYGDTSPSKDFDMVNAADSRDGHFDGLPQWEALEMAGRQMMYAAGILRFYRLVGHLF